MEKILSEDQQKIINKILENGFSPSDFIRTEDGLKLFLTYPNTPFTFSIFRNPDSFRRYRFQHTVYDAKYTKASSHPNSWVLIGEVLNSLTSFLKDHLRPYLNELNAPDPWAEFMGNPKSNRPAQFDFNDSTKFSQQEETIVATSLDTFIRQVKEQLRLSADQLKYLTGAVEYLKEESKKQTKLAWSLAFFGLFNSLATSVFADEIKIEIWRILKDSFETIKEVIPYLLNQ